MEDLEFQLQQAKNARIKLIVSDGAFSMDGKITPLKWAIKHSSNSLNFLLVESVNTSQKLLCGVKPVYDTGL